MEHLYTLLSSDIPPSLRPISVFLSEAQKCLREALESQDSSISSSRHRVTAHCIKHAFKLLQVVESHIDETATICLQHFAAVALHFVAMYGLEIDVTALQLAQTPQKLKIVVSHAEDVLIAEANEIMELAEEQLREGMRLDASRNFHAAAVYYRVLESILPSMSYEIHERLKLAAARTRETSTIAENFIQEHFSGASFSDYYDVHGRNKLGKGSYGSVYLATHRVTGDQRAVKVMNVDRITSYYLRKLHTEIAILREVDHPNIVKLQDVFFGRRSVYLVTDLCRGGELYELLTSGKSQGFVFREDRASSLLRDMLSAVNYLHSKNIVHRDLKLENFLFEGETSSSSLILIDFGLSKNFDRTERMRQRVGSCYYTAPEVLNGDYDERCDVWSLGVICYMLLSGSPPFHGKTPDDIHRATLTKEAEYPERRFKHVSPIGLDFMRRLLVKDPNARMTVKQALAHPFIRGSLALPSPADVSLMQQYLRNSLADRRMEILASFRHFAGLDSITRLVMQLIIYTLSLEQVHMFRSEFRIVDQDDSGTVSIHELLAIAGADESVEVERIFYTIVSMRHTHHNGIAAIPELSYNEFVTAATCNRCYLEPDRVVLAFEQLDRDSEGVLTAEVISRTLGVDIDAAQLNAEIQNFTTSVPSSAGLSSCLPGVGSPLAGVDQSAFLNAWNRAVGSGKLQALTTGVDAESSPMDES